MCRDLTHPGRLSLALVALLAVACGNGGDASTAAGPDDGVPTGGSGPAGGSGGSGPTGGSGPNGGSGGSGPTGGAEPNDPNFEARRAQLRFKGAARLREEYARILELPVDGLCREVGQFDCIDEIHQITLGGVEPYRANIFRPFPGVAVSASLAVERVALAACTTRIVRDAAAPEASVYFGRIPLEGDALADVNAPEVDAALTKLAREAWLRTPTADDLATLKGLYADVLAEGAPAPALTWAQLACMTVLTTSEALLY